VSPEEFQLSMIKELLTVRTCRFAHVTTYRSRTFLHFRSKAPSMICENELEAITRTIGVRDLTSRLSAT
jgi:hypothetical protein